MFPLPCHFPSGHCVPLFPSLLLRPQLLLAGDCHAAGVHGQAGDLHGPRQALSLFRQSWPDEPQVMAQLGTVRAKPLCVCRSLPQAPGLIPSFSLPPNSSKPGGTQSIGHTEGQHEVRVLSGQSCVSAIRSPMLRPRLGTSHRPTSLVPPAFFETASCLFRGPQ